MPSSSKDEFSIEGCSNSDLNALAHRLLIGYKRICSLSSIWYPCEYHNFYICFHKSWLRDRNHKLIEALGCLMMV